MAKLIADQLSMFPLTTLPDSDKPTSSAAFLAGPTLFDWRDGESEKSGPAPVPVSRFRARDSEKAMPTNDTSGPLFNASSPSASLQRSLENRLRQRMDVNGSPEFALTWSTWDMPSGPPICRLRASARPIGASASSGWPTPDGAAMNVGADPQAHLERLERLKEKHHNGNGAGLTLGIAAALVGWRTPQRMDGERGPALNADPKAGQHSLTTEARLAGWPTPIETDFKGKTSPSTGGQELTAVARLAGWATPRVRDADKGIRSPEAARKEIRRKEPQNELGLVTGLVPSGSPASTARRGALNPLFSLWLMLGTASAVCAWASCAPASKGRRGSAC